MELFLNMLWVALAIGALLEFLHKHVAGRNQFRLRLGALLCALAFLLPAISITDDLHPEAYAVEDASLGKRLVQSTVKADLGSQGAWLLTGFSIPLATWLPSIRRDLAVSFYFLPDLLLSSHILDRAPPCRCA